MNSTVLAILSDLHVGEQARAKDMCPEGESPKGVDEGYIEKFLGFITEKNIVADYLLIPGDVTNKSKPRQAALASEIVRRVAAALKVKKTKILFVPGNHDIDWSVLTDKGNPVRWGQRYAPLDYKDYVFHGIMRRGRGSLLDVPYVTVWKFEGMVVIGYNSSWHDNPDELMHHGRMDASHLTRIDALLGDFDGQKDLLRVFLLHHHPLAYDQPSPTGVDFSQMLNCEQLLAVLHKHYVDLLVHGHTHQPRFQAITTDGAHPIAVLAAGTFSFLLPLQWQGRVGNQFHVLTVKERNLDTRCIQGTVNSWTYYAGHGWISSVHERDGIDHFEAFGTYPNPAELRDLLRPLLADLFRRRDWAKWEDVTEARPALKYARTSAVLQSLRELSAELRFDLHERALEKLVLLKRRAKRASHR